MNRRTLFVPLLTVVLVVLLAAPALADNIFDGKVADVGSDRIVLTVGDEEITFDVNDKTMITLDGKEAKLKDLKRGHTASVTATKEDERWVASQIEAEMAP